MDRRTCSWVDVGGIQRQTYLSSAAGATGTFIDILNMTNADYMNWFEGTVNAVPTVAPLANAHISVGDVAAISTQAVPNVTGRLYIPAPVLALFVADAQYVNTSSAPYGTLQAQAIANMAVMPYTLPVTSFQEGWLEYQSRGARDDLVIGSLFVIDCYTLVWVDAQGRTTSTRIGLQSNLAGILAALNAASNAQIVEYWGGSAQVNPSPAPLTGDYQTVRDWAQIVASDAEGNLTSIVIPAPQRAIFLADAVTVDPGNSLVLSLYANILSELVVPSSGLPITSILGGRLRRNNRAGAR